MEAGRAQGAPQAARTGDLDLVRGVLARDAAATRRFAERLRCVPRLLAVRNERTGRPLTEAELEDLAQDVVISVWRKLERFDGRARLETWVFQFCYLEFLRRLRTFRQRPRLVAGGDEVLEQCEAHPQAAPDQAADVHTLLAQLDEEDASLLRLKHFEDLTFEEIGARLETSPNTVKTRYYRALGKLRARREQNPKHPTGGADPRHA